MFILGDESRTYGRFPWVTCSLVLLNVLVFSGQLVVGDRFTNGFALVPREITEARDFDRPMPHEVTTPIRARRTLPGQPAVAARKHTVWIEHARGPFPIHLTLFTSMFLHASWLHLIGNMWFLLAFGRNVECALDHGRFLTFYVVCGLAAGLIQVISEPSSIVPIVGASGAISGVMGAYVAIHPFNKVKIWMGWYWGIMEFPALAVLGFWFLTQYLAAFASLEAGASTGVAHWAHLGGFLAGIIYIRAMVVYLRWKEVMNPPPFVDESDDAEFEDEALRSPLAEPDAFQACLLPTGPKPSPLTSDAIQTAAPAAPSIHPLFLETRSQASAETLPARVHPAKSPPAMPKPTVVLPSLPTHLAAEAPIEANSKPSPLGDLWTAHSAKPRPGKRTPKSIVLPVWQRPFGVPPFRPIPHPSLRVSSAQTLNASAARSNLDSTAAFRDRRMQMLGDAEGNAEVFTVCLPRTKETPADPFASFTKPSQGSGVHLPPTVRVPLPKDMREALDGAFDYMPPVPHDERPS